MKIIRLEDVPIEKRAGYFIKRIATEPLHCNPENIGLYETTVPPGSACLSHVHHSLDEFIIFLTEGNAVVEGKDYDFKPGDVLVLEPNEAHEFYAQKKELKLLALKLPNIPEDKHVRPK